MKLSLNYILTRCILNKLHFNCVKTYAKYLVGTFIKFINSYNVVFLMHFKICIYIVYLSKMPLYHHSIIYFGNFSIISVDKLQNSSLGLWLGCAPFLSTPFSHSRVPIWLGNEIRGCWVCKRNFPQFAEPKVVCFALIN